MRSTICRARPTTIAARELRWLYDRRNLKEAEQDLQAWLTRWATRYPKLTDWVEAHIGEMSRAEEK